MQHNNNNNIETRDRHSLDNALNSQDSFSERSDNEIDSVIK
jgi:hypothetical protein